MKAKWSVGFRSDAAKVVRKLDKVSQTRILKFLQKVADNPLGPYAQAEPLQGQFKNCWRYRVGDYRIICELQDHKMVVWVVAVGHRREIYRG